MSREEKINEFLDMAARASAYLDQLQSNLDEQRQILDRQQESITKMRAHWQFLKEEALRDSQK